MRITLIILVAVAMLPLIVTAQSRDGIIKGTVVLADGSAIPGVVITLTSNKIGKRTSISSESGEFYILGLPPGQYTVKFEMEGFKTVNHTKVVRLGQTVILNTFMETLNNMDSAPFY